MWQAALVAIMDDTARVIDAARKGRRRVTIENILTPVSSLEAEIENARRYFRSPDYAEVCENAQQNYNPRRALKAAIDGNFICRNDGRTAAHRRLDGDVLNAIRQHNLTLRYQIADHMKLDPLLVTRILNRLEEDGKISIDRSGLSNIITAVHGGK